MTTTGSEMSDIKTELKYMIDQENDPSILKAVKTILKKRRLHPVVKEKLTHRAEAAERDIENGRTFSRQETEKRLDSGR